MPCVSLECIAQSGVDESEKNSNDDVEHQTRSRLPRYFHCQPVILLRRHLRLLLLIFMLQSSFPTPMMQVLAACFDAIVHGGGKCDP